MELLSSTSPKYPLIKTHSKTVFIHRDFIYSLIENTRLQIIYSNKTASGITALSLYSVEQFKTISSQFAVARV